MRKYGVGRKRNHLCIHFLEFRIELGHFLKLGRTDEREVGRVKHHDEPFAVKVRELQRLCVVVLKRFKLIVGNRFADAHMRDVLFHRVMEVAAVLAVVALLSVLVHKDKVSANN